YEAVSDGSYYFELNSSFATDQEVFLATTGFGILRNGFNEGSYQEIHPEGPSSNKVFSIEAQNNNLWIVYGGYNLSGPGSDGPGLCVGDAEARL
ncbi:MAG: hypothetical protein P8X52_09000, partial [Limibacillus sp.]